MSAAERTQRVGIFAYNACHLSAALVALGFLGGCASMRPTHSGFLEDYSRLTPTTDFINWGGGVHRVQVALPEAHDLDGVDSFYLEPIAWLAPDDDWLGASPSRRKRVSSALEVALRTKLAKIRPVVATPGPATAIVRAAVTDVKSSRPVINAILSVIAFGPISNGGASVEAEIRAADGHQIAAVDGGSAGGFIDQWGYYTRTGHPKTAAWRLAGELTDALKTGTCAGPKPTAIR